MPSASDTQNDPHTLLRRGLTKVPQVTAYFWVIKILTTGMGEAASDFLMGTLGLAAVVLSTVGLLVTLVVQFRARRYVPAVYWSAVAMVSVFGTMAADVLHRAGLSLWATSALYLVALGVIFGLWFAREGTLSFDAINTHRREAFYWAAVVATFALGTAVGDLTASNWGLGFLASGIMFAALILVPAGAGRWLGLSSVVTFWSAYVLTRPLGASFADWMAMPARHGGLGLGTGPVALLWLVAIVGFVAYLARSRTGITGDRAPLADEPVADARTGTTSTDR
jgi:uncharacterized membrane-anchored protein